MHETRRYCIHSIFFVPLPTHNENATKLRTPHNVKTCTRGHEYARGNIQVVQSFQNYQLVRQIEHVVKLLLVRACFGKSSRPM